MYCVELEISPIRPSSRDIIYVDYVEPPQAEEPPEPPKNVVAESPRHEHIAQTDNSRQVTGSDEQTRTVNPKALFKVNKGGADEVAPAGNPYAQAGEEDKASGDGAGLNALGNSSLDTGLQGRGLVGALPQPRYPAGNRGGKVVIRVAVDRSGRVTDAQYEPKGSTTSDNALISAAREAALKARFTESAAFLQGGTITYNFRMN